MSVPGSSSFACGTMRENLISIGPGLEVTLADVTFGAGDSWVVSPGTVHGSITLDHRNESGLSETLQCYIPWSW